MKERKKGVLYKIFVELEELRVQDLISLLNTVIVPTGSKEDLELYGDVLAGLVRDGCLSIGYDHKDRINEDLNKEKAIEFLTTLGDIASFDANSNYWKLTDREVKTDDRLAVILTDKGLQKAIDVLKAQ